MVPPVPDVFPPVVLVLPPLDVVPPPPPFAAAPLAPALLPPLPALVESSPPQAEASCNVVPASSAMRTSCEDKFIATGPYAAFSRVSIPFSPRVAVFLLRKKVGERRTLAPRAMIYSSPQRKNLERQPPASEAETFLVWRFYSPRFKTTGAVGSLGEASATAVFAKESRGSPIGAISESSAR